MIHNQFIVYGNIYVQYVPKTGGKHLQKLIWNLAASSDIHDKDIFDACNFLKRAVYTINHIIV